MYLLLSVAQGYTTLLMLFFYFFCNRNVNLIKGILLGSLCLLLIINLLVLYEVLFLNSYCFFNIGTWFKLGLINVSWSFYFDKLSVLMLFLIILISLLVHFFALDYLKEDPHLFRFLVFLSLFTFFMELLVSAGNIIQFFLGWEGVGLMSYLLINFWFTRYAASNSGLMAIIYNRLGDTGLLLGIVLICFILETTDFVFLFMILKLISQIKIKILYSSFYFIDVLTIFLFLGVIGKSAQIFLESWLASAMEGPTPVSSLLHASTMIVSGVFLLQRFQPYIFTSFFGMLLITIVGALTAFFAGTVGLFSMDLKRIIAYSTCSQMGYLVFCFGIGQANISLFHLFNHAFFKCLLFIAAGTLIHVFLNEQDIRKMGGMLKLFPFSFNLILFASLSLMGMPFLSGFYSKEKILEYSFYIYNEFNFLAFWLGTLSAFFTSLYSLRLIFFIFFNKPMKSKQFITKMITFTKIQNNTELWLIITKFILTISLIFSGFFFQDLITELGSDWSTSLKINDINAELGLFGRPYLNLLAFYYSISGFFISYIYYKFYKDNFNLFTLLYTMSTKSFSKEIPEFLDKKVSYRWNLYFVFFKKFYNFFAKRWYINSIYNRIIINVFLKLGYTYTFIHLDKGQLQKTRVLQRVLKHSTGFTRLSMIGELFIFLFIIFNLFFFINHIDLFSFSNEFDLYLLDFSNKWLFYFFFAVPRKKNRRKIISKYIQVRTLFQLFKLKPKGTKREKQLTLK